MRNKVLILLALIAGMAFAATSMAQIHDGRDFTFCSRYQAWFGIFSILLITLGIILLTASILLAKYRDSLMKLGFGVFFLGILFILIYLLVPTIVKTVFPSFAWTC